MNEAKDMELMSRENECELKCEQLAEEIKQKLHNLSDELNVDINTLWLVFEACAEKMKDDIKREYNEMKTFP